MIGTSISHYKILSKLGEGGMGVVYKAEDLKLKRTVALKFLPPELTRDQDAKTRFIHEAQAASALQHDNICVIHEIDETPDGQLFIAMDCYDGETLKEKIGKGRLGMDEALDIACQVSVGLSKAHGAGMVHRDIKPANIMVTRDGVAKMLDFGLAKLAGQTKVTKTGTTVGTISYMSPEQAKGEGVDARSDIFSLGAVLYEMLTGEAPFPGEHEAAVLYGIMHGEPKRLAGIDKSIPQAMQGIIDKALAKDPKERYQNVLDFVDDLETVSVGAGEQGKKRHRRSRRMPDAAKKTRARRRMAIGAAAGIVVVLVGFILGPRMWRSVQVAPAHALAVMDFRDLATPEDPTVSAGLTELVNIGLIQASPVRVISSEYLHDLSRRLFGVAKGPIEESQAMEIARKAEATLLLVATIGKSGENQFVTWRMVEAKSGKNVGAERVEGNTLTQLADEIIGHVLPLIASATGATATTEPTAVKNITTTSSRAYQHYVAGLLADEEGRIEGAIAELQKAVAQDSTFALAYLRLGRTYRNFLDDASSEKYLETAWRFRSRLGSKDQMRLEALLLLGPFQSLLGHRDRWETRVGEAIAILREMRNRWPDDREVLIDLQLALGNRWYHAEALQVSEEGLKVFPDDDVLGGPRYLQSLACLGRTEEALRATQSYVKRNPDVPKGWHQLGRRYLEVGLPDSAEVAFQKVVELDPETYAECLNYCAYYRGDLKGATFGFEKLLEQKNLSASRRYYLIVPSHNVVHLAALYVEAGRYRKMRDVCREYMALSRADMAPLRLLVEMGQAREVLGFVEDLVKSGIERADIYPRPVGRALAMLGDAESARAEAAKLSQMEDKRGGMARYDALEIQARAAVAAHDPKTALEFLGKMKRQGIFFGGFIDIDYRTALAMAYRMKGRLQEAADVHKEMLRIYGGHALSHYELGTIYEEMERPADAKKEYAKFLEMWSEADDGLPQLVDARQRLARL